jgi:Flp pilus assembly pilin Flp
MAGGTAAVRTLVCSGSKGPAQTQTKPVFGQTVVQESCSNADRGSPPAAELINKAQEEITLMKTLVQRFQQLHKDEAGQGLIEYVMLSALVISAAAACFPGLASALTTAFTNIGTKLGTYIT